MVTFKNFPRIRSHQVLKFGMQHRGFKIYKVYINDNPGLTMTYLLARSNLDACAFAFEKENLQSYLMGNLQQMIMIKSKEDLFLIYTYT